MKYSSPSDYTAIAPNYATGQGYYTNSTLVADLLQIPAFSGSTNPTHAQVGNFIKRMEDYIDEITDNSWRPIMYINEVHKSWKKLRVLKLKLLVMELLKILKLKNNLSVFFFLQNE